MSSAVAGYLKAIYELEDSGQPATNSALAHRLAVAPASVTGMLRKLAEHHPRLVDYQRYHGAALTPAGRKIALETIRRHRLLELYLADALGYEWDRVNAEADQLERVISPEFEQKIAALLGYPTADPHGDPIPGRDGPPAVAPRLGRLSAAAPGQRLRVLRVSADDPAVLRYLAELGIAPHTYLIVIAQAPFDGPVTVSVGGCPHALGRNVAEQICVMAVPA